MDLGQTNLPNLENHHTTSFFCESANAIVGVIFGAVVTANAIVGVHAVFGAVVAANVSVLCVHVQVVGGVYAVRCAYGAAMKATVCEQQPAADPPYLPSLEYRATTFPFSFARAFQLAKYRHAL